jgi:hypothetical protein
MSSPDFSILPLANEVKVLRSKGCCQEITNGASVQEETSEIDAAENSYPTILSESDKENKNPRRFKNCRHGCRQRLYSRNSGARNEMPAWHAVCLSDKDGVRSS